MEIEKVDKVRPTMKNYKKTLLHTKGPTAPRSKDNRKVESFQLTIALMTFLPTVNTIAI